jgi:hypothetical protein
MPFYKSSVKWDISNIKRFLQFSIKKMNLQRQIKIITNHGNWKLYLTRYTHANYLQPNRIISSWLKYCALQRQSHFWTAYTKETQFGINIYRLCDLRDIHVTRLCILAMSQKMQLHGLVQYAKPFRDVPLRSFCSSVIQCGINIPHFSLLISS